MGSQARKQRRNLKRKGMTNEQAYAVAELINSETERRINIGADIVKAEMMEEYKPTMYAEVLSIVCCYLITEKHFGKKRVHDFLMGVNEMIEQLHHDKLDNVDSLREGIKEMIGLDTFDVFEEMSDEHERSELERMTVARNIKAYMKAMA